LNLALSSSVLSCFRLLNIIPSGSGAPSFIDLMVTSNSVEEMGWSIICSNEARTEMTCLPAAEDNSAQPVWRSGRARKPPSYLKDFVLK
jgi:hypothetical protein